MDNEKEKPTGVVAYLAYARILWVASAEVRRQMRDVFCVCLHFLFSCTLLKTRYLDAWQEKKKPTDRSVLAVRDCSGAWTWHSQAPNSTFLVLTLNISRVIINKNQDFYGGYLWSTSKHWKPVTFARAHKTAAVVNAKLLANLLARPAVVSQTKSAKTQRRTNLVIST